MAMIQEEHALVYVRDEISEIIILVSTEKGAFLYYSDNDRRYWDINGPHFLGSIVNHLVLDNRDNKTLIASVKSQQSGPTIYHSKDFGKSWTEAIKSPAFKNNKFNRTIDHICYITPGHASEPGVWYAGSSPQGIFRSIDNGKNWESIDGFNYNLKWKEWTTNSTKEHTETPKLHSILIDPTDKNHIYIGLSYGGVFETKDQGKTWKPMNNGIESNYLNDKTKFGYYPHALALHPLNPKRIYQQNQCGIYRLDLPRNTWMRIGKNMPADIGDRGLSIILHPSEPNTIWVFPIDKNQVWSKVSSDGQPALYCSQDGGDTWFRQDVGLPMRNAWFTVLRKGLATDQLDNTGLYFGTTSGSLWMSDNEGNSWRQMAVHLPKILAVETGVILKNI